MKEEGSVRGNLCESRSQTDLRQASHTFKDLTNTHTYIRFKEWKRICQHCNATKSSRRLTDVASLSCEASKTVAIVWSFAVASATAARRLADSCNGEKGQTKRHQVSFTQVNGSAIFSVVSFSCSGMTMDNFVKDGDGIRPCSFAGTTDLAGTFTI